MQTVGLMFTNLSFILIKNKIIQALKMRLEWMRQVAAAVDCISVGFSAHTHTVTDFSC